MNLKIQYEDKYQDITLNNKDFEDTWISVDLAIVKDEELKPEVKEEISLKGKESLPMDEREVLLQKAWKVIFNRPDYNNWHTFRRHTGYSREEGDNGEPSRLRVFHESSVFNVEEELETEENYNEICRQIRECLKPEWAELFIAVHIDGESIRDYAASIGGSENNLTKKLERAEKKLKKIFSKRQI